ncbi:MAG TPA: hypothetical protein VNK52_16960 [Hyphomicrobiaceae bacterium]|nr:hypothetical protein [Hyphomicrobiaceae bacterium]
MVVFRLLIALLFASATVVALAAPMAAKGWLGHDAAAYQVSTAETPCHQHPSPTAAPDDDGGLSCLGCVIHCLGMATLEAIASLQRPCRWLGDGIAEQDDRGLAPAGLERPPNGAG